MTPTFIKTTTVNGLQHLQLFNQNTLHLCHNMLRHLPRNKSAYTHVHRGFDRDRASEIELFLLDQTERLIEISEKNRINPTFGIDIPSIQLRSDTEKRFTDLLGHSINYSQGHNPKVYETLYVEYSNGERGVWDKERVDKLGGRLKGKNPIKLFKFAKAIADAIDAEGRLSLTHPLAKEPSKELKFKDEQEKILMTLIQNGSIELKEDMRNDEFVRIVMEIRTYSEALKLKENSIKIRQETLMSIYQGNPSGEVKDMLMGTNAMAMDLKREQLILNDVVKSVSEFSVVHGFKNSEHTLDHISETMSKYSFLNDDKLRFIIPADKLEQIKGKDNEQGYEMTTGAR